jgi:hypothetical protein
VIAFGGISRDGLRAAKPAKMPLFYFVANTFESKQKRRMAGS